MALVGDYERDVIWVALPEKIDRPKRAERFALV
jgi:hypothetical protein